MSASSKPAPGSDPQLASSHDQPPTVPEAGPETAATPETGQPPAVDEVRDRRCPRCRRRLVWHETRMVGGRLLDYYERCAGGCGLFYFDRPLSRMIRFMD